MPRKECAEQAQEHFVQWYLMLHCISHISVRLRRTHDTSFPAGLLFAGRSLHLLGGLSPQQCWGSDGTDYSHSYFAVLSFPLHIVSQSDISWFLLRCCVVRVGSHRSRRWQHLCLENPAPLLHKECAFNCIFHSHLDR